MRGQQLSQLVGSALILIVYERLTKTTTNTLCRLKEQRNMAHRSQEPWLSLFVADGVSCHHHYDLSGYMAAMCTNHIINKSTRTA